MESMHGFKIHNEDSLRGLCGWRRLIPLSLPYSRLRGIHIPVLGSRERSLSELIVVLSEAFMSQSGETGSL